jgi:hypothetical protein
MPVPNLRPLGFGEILDGAFTLYRRNLVTFFVTALVPVLAMIAVFVLLGGGMFAAMSSGDPTAVFGAIFGIGMLLFAVGLLTFLVMWGALGREASDAYLGRPTSVGAGFRAGFRAFFPLLGAAIVVLIAMVVVFFAIGIVMAIMMAVGGASGSMAGSVVMTFVSFVLGAGVYLAVISLLFAVLPAVVVEGKGPMEAIARSFDLARGAVGRIVGLMLVTLLITYLPGMAVIALTGGFAQMMDTSQVPSMGQFMTQQVLGLAVNILTTPFMVSVMILLYFDRRVRTEALDVQMAAENLAPAGS